MGVQAALVTVPRPWRMSCPGIWKTPGASKQLFRNEVRKQKLAIEGGFWRLRSMPLSVLLELKELPRLLPCIPGTVVV